MKNLNNNLIDWNSQTVNKILKKENTLAILLEDKSTISSNFTELLNHYNKNFTDIRETLLIFLFYISNFFEDETDSLYENIADLTMSNLSMGSVPNIEGTSLHSMLSSHNSRLKLPFICEKHFTCSSNNLLELISLFGEDFIHSEIIDFTKRFSDSYKTVEDLYSDGDIHDIYDYFSHEFSYVLFDYHDEKFNFEFNKNYLSNEEFKFFELINEWGEFTHYINIHSDELSNYIATYIDNKEILDSIFKECRSFLTLYYPDIVSISKPVVIDNSSIFHKNENKYSLLFACTSNYYYIEYDQVELRYNDFKSAVKSLRNINNFLLHM